MLRIVAIVLFVIGCNGIPNAYIPTKTVRPAPLPAPLTAPAPFPALGQLPMAVPAPYPLRFPSPRPALSPSPALRLRTPFPVKAPPTQQIAVPAPAYPSKNYLPSAKPSGAQYGPIRLAVQSSRSVQLVPTAYNSGYAKPKPQLIEVSPVSSAVQVLFKSSSSPVTVQQQHTPGLANGVQYANFEDKPHRVVHTVTKPIIQEVREIIQPYRRIVQEIRPVIEEVKTIIHKGEKTVDLKAKYYINSRSLSSEGHHIIFI